MWPRPFSAGAAGGSEGIGGAGIAWRWEIVGSSRGSALWDASDFAPPSGLTRRTRAALLSSREPLARMVRFPLHSYFRTDTMDKVKTFLVEDSSVVRENLIAALEENT